MKWRSIKTAPKDGTKVLLWREGWDCAPVGVWAEVYGCDGIFFGWQFEDEDQQAPNAVQEGFVGWNEDIDAGAMPTHWSSLPESSK